MTEPLALDVSECNPWRRRTVQTIVARVLVLVDALPLCSKRDGYHLYKMNINACHLQSQLHISFTRMCLKWDHGHWLNVSRLGTSPLKKIAPHIYTHNPVCSVLLLLFFPFMFTDIYVLLFVFFFCVCVIIHSLTNAEVSMLS